MDPNRNVARREPPAAGLATGLRRNADSMMYCSHNGTKKNVQLRTVHHLFLSSAKCHSRDRSPMTLHIPLIPNAFQNFGRNRFL